MIIPILFTTGVRGLRMPSWTGKTWNIQNVETTTFLPIFSGPCYLSLDSHGNPHISYEEFSTANSAIIYATANETSVPNHSPESTVIPSSTLIELIVAAILVLIIAVGLLFYGRHQKTAKLKLIYADVNPKDL